MKYFFGLEKDYKFKLESVVECKWRLGFWVGVGKGGRGLVFMF